MSDAQKHSKQVSNMNSNVNTRWFFGTVFESHFSYSAVRRVGDMVYTSGLMAVDEDANAVCEKGDADLQTRYILDKISTALQHVGSCMEDIVHVNIYTAQISDTLFIASEFSKRFSDILPTITLLQIAHLPRDDCTVMIQVQAIVQQHNNKNKSSQS